MFRKERVILKTNFGEVDVNVTPDGGYAERENRIILKKETAVIANSLHVVCSGALQYIPVSI